MRATIVSCVPSRTGEGERLSKLTSGNDSSSWACVLPPKTSAARLRQKARARTGRAPATRLRADPLSNVRDGKFLATARIMATPRRAVLGPQLKPRRTPFIGQCQTIVPRRLLAEGRENQFKSLGCGALYLGHGRSSYTIYGHIAEYSVVTKEYYRLALCSTRIVEWERSHDCQDLTWQWAGAKNRLIDQAP